MAAFARASASGWSCRALGILGGCLLPGSLLRRMHRVQVPRHVHREAKAPIALRALEILASAASAWTAEGAVGARCPDAVLVDGDDAIPRAREHPAQGVHHPALVGVEPVL